MARFARCIMLFFLAVLFAGTVPQASAQVVINFGHHHRHHRRYYHHHHRR